MTIGILKSIRLGVLPCAIVAFLATLFHDSQPGLSWIISTLIVLLLAVSALCSARIRKKERAESLKIT